MATATKSKSNGSAELSISVLSRQHILVPCVGMTPLLTNRLSEKAVKAIEDDQSGRAKIKKEPRNPEQEFLDAVYWIGVDRSRWGIPAAGIKKAMVLAGQRFANETGTELMGAFSIPETLVEIVSPHPVMRTDRVMLGGRTMSLAYRPEYWPWRMEVPLLFNSAFISMDQIVNLLNLAGFSVGVGAWRQEKKGTHGQFRVDGDIQQLA